MKSTSSRFFPKSVVKHRLLSSFYNPLANPSRQHETPNLSLARPLSRAYMLRPRSIGRPPRSRRMVETIFELEASTKGFQDSVSIDELDRSNRSKRAAGEMRRAMAMQKRARLPARTTNDRHLESASSRAPGQADRGWKTHWLSRLYLRPAQRFQWRNRWGDYGLVLATDSKQLPVRFFVLQVLLLRHGHVLKLRARTCGSVPLNTYNKKLNGTLKVDYGYRGCVPYMCYVFAQSCLSPKTKDESRIIKSGDLFQGVIF
jgi:hypothetical protein